MRAIVEPRRGAETAQGPTMHSWLGTTDRDREHCVCNNKNFHR